jgi:hypothetical protein
MPQIMNPQHIRRRPANVQPQSSVRHPESKSLMKPVATAIFLLAVTLLAPQRLRAQASEIPSAAPPTIAGQTDAQRGKLLIDQMIAALGGDAWLNRTTVQFDGRTSSFYRGAPNPYITEYHELHRFAAQSSPAQPEADRIGFLTPRGMILPGKVTDVVQIWTDAHGYEITYKGQTELPKEQVDDYYRRRAHSIEEVVHTWINAPGVMLIGEGTSMVGRRIADKLTILGANNDAVTLELDASTHLPVRRTFQWRNPQFKDFDEEAEEYDDYHTVQGLPTPMTITRYHNGEMANQRYITKVVYNAPLAPDLFDPAILLKKKK